MPITVNCDCGKIFKVKDEHEGKRVRCQVCRAAVTVPLKENEAASEALLEPLAAAPADSQANAATDTMECPACAEDIPENSLTCPYCKESLKRHITPKHKQELLRKMMQELSEHTSNRNIIDEDEALRGGLFSIKAIISFFFLAASLAAIITGFFIDGRDSEPYFIMGGICGVISGIVTLVVFVSDYSAHYIQQSKTPVKAFKRYFSSLKAKRTAQAYVSLVPSAREVDNVQSPAFKKIHAKRTRYSIQDVKSFAEYWKSIFTGPSNYVRSVRLKKVRQVKETEDGLFRITAELEFTSYSQWIIITVLASIWITLILILILREKENKTIHKLLVRHEEKWYLAEGELEGILDTAELNQVQA